MGGGTDLSSEIVVQNWVRCRVWGDGGQCQPEERERVEERIEDFHLCSLSLLVVLGSVSLVLAARVKAARINICRVCWPQWGEHR